MNQSIGINRNKKLDSITKRVKVPAITQRQYYKDNIYEQEYINFYKSDDEDNESEYFSEPDYLDDSRNGLDEGDIYDEDNCCCLDEYCGSNGKTMAIVGLSVVVGIMGICLLKRGRR